MMTEEHVSKKFADKGLLKGARAPIFNAKDIHGEEVNLEELLRKHEYILIDFFRGAW